MDILFLTTVGTVAGTLLALEARAWMPHISRQLLDRALAAFTAELPDELSARWAEEIEADLESYADRPLGGLRFALALRLKGARTLAAELAREDVIAPHGPEPRPETRYVLTERGREMADEIRRLNAVADTQNLETLAALLLSLGEEENP